MPLDSATRQQLLELVYDLLDDEQAALLRRRIESEPELAAAWAEARRTAALFADAARVESPKVELRRIERVAAAATVRARPARDRVSPWTRGANWAVSLAATILLAFSLGGYFYHRHELGSLAAGHLRLLVTGPDRLEAGATNTYTVATSTVTGAPLPAKIEVALYSPDGRRLLRQEEQTNDEGRLRVSVPARMNLPGEARLEVVATYGSGRETVSAQMPVVPVRYAAWLQTDRSDYRPGDAVRFRAVVLSRFQLAPGDPLTVRLAILDPQGRAASGWPRLVRAEQGVAAAEWAVPSDASEGRYQLVVESPEDAFETQIREIVVADGQAGDGAMDLEFSRLEYRPGDTVVAYFAAKPGASALSVKAELDGAVIYQSDPPWPDAGPLALRFPLPAKISRGAGRLEVTLRGPTGSQTLARSIPLAPVKLDLRFQPEGGSLVAGLRNRVYFTARDAQGRPVEMRGMLVDSRDADVAELDTIQAGMGLFSFTPSAGEQYRVRITTPSGIADEPRLPEATVQTNVVFGGGPSVFAAGKPLEIQLDALGGELPLVVAATCRGVLVGQQALVTSATRQQNRLVIPLAAEAAGLIRVSVYEYRSPRPKLAAERLVFRRPAARLDVSIADGLKPYAPGREVGLSLLSRDEKGAPAAAVLGVLATAARPADLSAPGLPAEVYFDGLLDNLPGRDAALACLADEARPSVPLDLMLGTRFQTAWQPIPAGENGKSASPPMLVGAPAVLDNLGQIRSEYERSRAAYHSDRTKALNTLTTLSFFGGFGLVLLVAMLATLKIVSGIRLWVPAAAAAIVCLVVGAVLMNPDRFQPGLDAAVAYVPYHGATQLAMTSGLMASDRSAADTAEPPREAAAAAAPLREREQEMEQSLEGLGRAPMLDAARRDAPAAPAAPSAAPPARLEKGHSLGLGAGGGSRGVLRAAPSPSAASKPAIAAPKPPAADGTLLWQPALKADSEGRAEVAVRLAAPGAYSVRVDAYDAGRLGHAERPIECRVPFQLEPNVPAALVVGDQFDMPLVASNATEQPATVKTVLQAATPLRLAGEAARTIELAPGQTRQEQFRFSAAAPGSATVTVRGQAGTLSDRVSRTVEVAPSGYPVVHATSGLLRGQQSVTVDVPAPVPGTLSVTLVAMPTFPAQLDEAQRSLAAQPAGCASRAAASAWLSALALEWMERDGAAPDVARQWRQRLDEALDQLADAQSPPRGFAGYEWFGGHPANEQLSAFVLAALDVVRRGSGRDADCGALADWLLARRDAAGQFRASAKSLGPAAAPELLQACAVWALAGHDPKRVAAQLKPLAAAAIKSDNAQVVALTAGALLAAEAKDQAAPVLDRLASLQRDDGRVEGRDAAPVESTALAAMAWTRAGRSAPAGRAIDWLLAARRPDGGFGPPRATALALSGLAEQARSRPRQPGGGKIIAHRGDTLLAEQEFGPAQTQPVVLAGLERGLRPGKNGLSLTLVSTDAVPYLLRTTYATTQAPANTAPLSLSTRLDRPLVPLGKPAALAVEVGNTSPQPLPLVVAVVGLPAGLQPQLEQLAELKKSGAIDQYSLNGRHLALFWRSMVAAQKTAVQVQLVGALVGQFNSPPSTAYLDQSPGERTWAAPLRIEVSP